MKRRIDDIQYIGQDVYTKDAMEYLEDEGYVLNKEGDAYILYDDMVTPWSYWEDDDEKEEQE